MSKKVAIVQSNYIPWKGYFDLINMVDEFILFDDMQYTRRDWRNRNKIKTPQGLVWLTIPVDVKGKYHQKIKDTVVSDPDWHHTHWKTIMHHYARYPYFEQYRSFFEDLYQHVPNPFLSQINHHFLQAICQLLGITTRLTWSMDYEIVEGKTERLVSLCQQAGASIYLSGPSARGYIDEVMFEQADIALEFIDYAGYPEYPQLFPPFEHGVSIIDLIFNTGPAVTRYMRSFV
jgi:hypothetical protein